MSRRGARRTRSLMVRSAELAFAAPQVVAHRALRLALAGATPSTRDRNEFQRMGNEKAEAFADSLNAMSMHAFRVQQSFGWAMWRSMWQPWTGGRRPAVSATALNNAAIAMFAQGIAPYHRRAVANARRLARTKLR